MKKALNLLENTVCIALFVLLYLLLSIMVFFGFEPLNDDYYE